MGWLRTASLLLVCTGWCLGQFRALPGGRKASEDFDCVEEFGYYPHPTDCSRYYVCVFGGALEESCSSGLVYSIELQTCDWPRNVASCDPKTGTPRPQLSRSRGHSSRGPSKATPAVQLVTTRRPNFRQPVRNALDGRTAASSSVAERFRILDNIADRDRPFDFERAIEQDNNKIVARRQQKLLSADSSGGRGRFQQPAVQSLHRTDNSSATWPPPSMFSSRAGVAIEDSTGRQPRRAPFIPPPLRQGGNPFRRAQLSRMPSDSATPSQLDGPSGSVVFGLAHPELSDSISALARQFLHQQRDGSVYSDHHSPLLGAAGPERPPQSYTGVRQREHSSAASPAHHQRYSSTFVNAFLNRPASDVTTYRPTSRIEATTYRPTSRIEATTYRPPSVFDATTYRPSTPQVTTYRPLWLSSGQTFNQSFGSGRQPVDQYGRTSISYSNVFNGLPAERRSRPKQTVDDSRRSHPKHPVDDSRRSRPKHPVDDSRRNRPSEQQSAHDGVLREPYSSVYNDPNPDKSYYSPSTETRRDYEPTRSEYNNPGVQDYLDYGTSGPSFSESEKSYSRNRKEPSRNKYRTRSESKRPYTIDEGNRIRNSNSLLNDKHKGKYRPNQDKDISYDRIYTDNGNFVSNVFGYDSAPEDALGGNVSPVTGQTPRRPHNKYSQVNREKPEQRGYPVSKQSYSNKPNPSRPGPGYPNLEEPTLGTYASDFDDVRSSDASSQSFDGDYYDDRHDYHSATAALNSSEGVYHPADSHIPSYIHSSSFRVPSDSDTDTANSRLPLAAHSPLPFQYTDGTKSQSSHRNIKPTRTTNLRSRLPDSHRDQTTRTEDPRSRLPDSHRDQTTRIEDPRSRLPDSHRDQTTRTEDSRSRLPDSHRDQTTRTEDPRSRLPYSHRDQTTRTEEPRSRLPDSHRDQTTRTEDPRSTLSDSHRDQTTRTEDPRSRLPDSHRDQTTRTEDPRSRLPDSHGDQTTRTEDPRSRLPDSHRDQTTRTEEPRSRLPDSHRDQTTRTEDPYRRRGNFRLKTTDPPVQISTISSFSFGDTGTRFPFRGSSAAPSTPAPPPRATSHRPATLLPTRFPSRHSPSTFVGSTRTSVSPASRGPVTRRTIAFQPSTTPAPTRRQSLFTPAPTRRQSPTTPAFRQSPTAPARRQSPTTPAPARQGFTEPAYVAYFNDTIYDVYYIYDDDDVQYDEVDYPDVTASTPRSTTTASTTTTTTTRRPPPVTQIHTVFSQPKSTPARRRIPLFSLDNIRDSVLGKTAAGVNRPQNRPHKTAASPFSLGSSGGSTTLGAAFGTGSARGTTRGSHGSTRSGFKQTSQRTTAAAAERTRQRPSKSKLVTSSRRTPSTGLKSIDTSSSRRPSSPRLPKRPNALSKSSTTKVNIWAHPPYRPAPLYPQPVPDEPAERCDARCRLPDCNCGGTANPGGLTTAQTPQLVVVTFDDSVNDLNRDLYEEMFESGRTNPNGCPISGTFYVSHEWTNYKQVQNLYADGHEIASHSISHSFGEQFSTSKWEAEIAGQREILAAYGGVRMEDVRGMRAPFLSIGGNRMFKMLYNNNFTYDSSMPVYENNPPSWPYTLDYKIHHDCMIPPCPNKAYPGVWEVPMVMWQDLNGGRCSMVDACTAPSSAEEVYNMLIKNFQRHYSTNRAVLPLYFHAAWMTTKHHREGFMAFLDTISKMDDVWLVTNWQVIQWMRDPQPLSNINNFKPFGCSYPERPPRCVKAKKCNVWHKSGVRYMTTCQPCPQKYPWTGRTGVSKP